MEGQMEASSVQLGAVGSGCEFESCNQAASADVDSQHLCLEHFISVSMKELDVRSAGLKDKAYGDIATDDFRHFLQACEKEASRLSQSEPHSESPVDPRLLEVLRRVAQLGGKLRRSPRFEASVPVWLRREDPGRTWEEQTWTSSVSRFGAGFSVSSRRGYRWRGRSVPPGQG